MISTTLGGTGTSLAKASIIVAGVSALVASLLSLVSIWFQIKNYRKPLLQRYVVRILLMVPIYAISSWTGMVSSTAAQVLDPIRDVYEAFTIFTFFQLLINFLSGERALIIMAHGRPPVSHAWPMNHFLPKVDISDPYTFLSIKRGILQYAWLKPVLAIVTIVMKATGTYQEGYLGVTSGYLWIGILYNLSVSLSLYSLAMFWVCMYDDLLPFRPVPKFLCVKLIIFASYWQGFFLAILQFLGALGHVAGYTPDNLAAAIQDTLICLEMPFFALAHWYAFSWHDYADPTISSARMPVKYALRDAFGGRDLLEDTKMTLRGDNYDYRIFDSGDNIIAHADSESRVKRTMEGMRYKRGGKGKYWIPKPGDIARRPSDPDSRTPLLRDNRNSRRQSSVEDSTYGELESTLDDDDERLFANARAHEFGDWNYPVITANEVPRDQRLPVSRSYQHASTEDNVKKSRSHRKGRASGSESRRNQNVGSSKSSKPKNSDRRQSLQRNPSSTNSNNSHRSQLVDLVVENYEAEEEERAQAIREYGADWPEATNKQFTRPSGEKIEEGDKSSEESAQTSTTHVNYALDDDNVWDR